MLEREFEAGLTGVVTPHARFPIYRNNVSHALIGALRVRYPVVEQLVGSRFFSAMAGAYSDGCKPSSAVLIYYGASFADFIATFEGAQALEYLPEVAHFENAWWHAYHAAEFVSLEASSLSEIPPEEWGQIRFKFHPTVGFFHSKRGAASIWQWHQTPNNPDKLGEVGEEFALISRPNAEVEVRLIAADAFAFLQHLETGSSLEEALAATQNAYPNFDLQSIFGALFQLGLVIGVTK